MWKARSLEEHQIHAGGRGFKPVKPDKVDGKKKSSNQYGCDIEPYYLYIDIVLLFHQYTTDLLSPLIRSVWMMGNLIYYMLVRTS